MSILQLLGLLVGTAALFGWMSERWLKVPITIGTMLLTVIASLGLLSLSGPVPALATWAQHLTSQISFENLILHGMLPFLLFGGAFLLDLQALAKEKLLVGVLALAGTVLAAALIALIMGLGLPVVGLHPRWIECLFFGALISPTDPIAVMEMLRRIGVSKQIEAQLAGESLFNDGVGAVLFLALLATSRGEAPSALQLSWMLVLEAGGALVLGVAAAWVCSKMMQYSRAYQIDILFSIALAIGGYGLAEKLHLSAPLEAVAAGLGLRYWNQRSPRESIAHESLDHFWEVVDEVQNAVLFVLLGLEILAIRFDPRMLLGGGAAIIAVTVTRVAVVALLVTLVRFVQKGHASSIAILSWGGLRGGLSLALALSVPDAMGKPWILAATYSVVLFSIVVQGGSMDVFLRRMLLRQARS
jgi:CPA1 family monovalent cation:H+ antiporter